MRYADQLYVMRHCYPSLFPQEWDALDHLFATIGNGYEWVNGELSDGDERPVDAQVQAAFERHVAQEQRHIESGGLAARYAAERLALLHQPIEAQWADELDYRKCYTANLPKRKDPRRSPCWLPHADGSVVKVVYPICGYARILHIPADIKPDWHEAACRFFDYIDSGHLKLRRGDAGKLRNVKRRLMRQRGRPCT